MKIKLNDKKVSFVNGVSNTQWLDIKYINKDLWRIETDKLLTNPIKSYDSQDNTVPWKYELRSFFKQSDENPISCYESPYIRLMRDGEYYSDLSVIAYDKVFMTSTFAPFAVKTGTTHTLFAIAGYKPAYSLTGRSITLGGEYIQFEQVSWESYQWVLYDADGNKMQDTGKKYGSSMEVTFYGLANDTDKDNTYYAILYVEDELNNTLQYTIKIVVEKASPEQLLIPFNTSFDCATHSVILDYQDNGEIAPSYRIGHKEQAYVEDNATVVGLWDGGINYITDGMNITGYNSMTDPEIDYNQGTTIKKDDIHYNPKSKSTMYGVNYNSFFPNDSLSISKETEDYDDAVTRLNSDEKGTFYFDTEVSLDDNFCGRILSVNVENYASKALEDPYITDGGFSDLTNYLTIELFIPDNFQQNSGANINTLSDNRNKVGLWLKSNAADAVAPYVMYFQEDNTNQNWYEWFDKTNIQNHLYYLQYENEVISNRNEYLHYDWMSLTNNQYDL